MLNLTVVMAVGTTALVFSDASFAQQYRTTNANSSYPTVGPSVIQPGGASRSGFQNAGPPAAQRYQPIFGGQQSTFPSTGPQIVQPSGAYRTYNNVTTPAPGPAWAWGAMGTAAGLPAGGAAPLAGEVYGNMVYDYSHSHAGQTYQLPYKVSPYGTPYNPPPQYSVTYGR